MNDTIKKCWLDFNQIISGRKTTLLWVEWQPNFGLPPETWLQELDTWLCSCQRKSRCAKGGLFPAIADTRPRALRHPLFHDRQGLGTTKALSPNGIGYFYMRDNGVLRGEICDGTKMECKYPK